MKKLVGIIALAITFSFFSNQAEAQAWTKDTKLISANIGGASFIYFYPSGYYGGYYGGYRGRAAFFGRGAFTGLLNVQGEFGVHEYVGVGFTAGFGFKAGNGRYYYTVPEINMPVGAIANFHFYQLIADKTGKNIHADKLDIYAGVNAGTGFAVQRFDGSNHLVPIAFFGVHGGVRYYFAPKVGVNAEVGFGKSVALVGFVFKL